MPADFSVTQKGRNLVRIRNRPGYLRTNARAVCRSIGDGSGLARNNSYPRRSDQHLHRLTFRADQLRDLRDHQVVPGLLVIGDLGLGGERPLVRCLGGSQHEQGRENGGDGLHNLMCGVLSNVRAQAVLTFMSIPLYSRVVKAKRPIEPTGNGVKVAYSYRRFSSRQQGTGTSLERQLKMAREACTTHGWRLVDLPPDRGISAFRITDLDGQQAANFHKGALGAFLAKVEAKEVKVPSVLCLERLDRFSRNYFDIVFPVWLKLLQSGIEIYSCVSGVHYTLDAIRKTPMLAGMALMELANANEYSSGMSKRIGEAFSLRLAEAAKGQKVNLGSWQPRWVDFIGSKGQPGEFRLNEHAATMQRIVREYLGGGSMYQIAKGLIRDKKPCLQNGKWSQGTIANLLRHDSLTGNKTIKRFKLVHYYPRLISDREWEQLKAKLADNSAKRGGNPTGDYIANLFRNRCKCFKCGGTMSTEHGYYRCKNRRVGTCDAKCLSALKIWNAISFLAYWASIRSCSWASIARSTIKKWRL